MTDQGPPTLTIAEIAHSVCALNTEVIEELQTLAIDPIARDALVSVLTCNTDYIRRLTASYLEIGDKIAEMAKKVALKKS